MNPGPPGGFDSWGTLDRYKAIRESSVRDTGRQAPAIMAMAIAMDEGISKEALDEGFWPTRASLGRYWREDARDVAIGRLTGAGMPEGVAGVGTDVLMGGMEAFQDYILEPWEVVFARTAAAGGNYGLKAREIVERALGNEEFANEIANSNKAEDIVRQVFGDHITDMAIDDGQFAENLAYAGLDVAGGALIKAGVKHVPKITKALQGAMAAGITAATGAELIDKANEGDLSAKDTALGIVAGLGAFASTAMAFDLIKNLRSPTMRESVGYYVGVIANERGTLGQSGLDDLAKKADDAAMATSDAVMKGEPEDVISKLTQEEALAQNTYDQALANYGGHYPDVSNLADDFDNRLDDIIGGNDVPKETPEAAMLARLNKNLQVEDVQHAANAKLDEVPENVSLERIEEGADSIAHGSIEETRMYDNADSVGQMLMDQASKMDPDDPRRVAYLDAARELEGERPLKMKGAPGGNRRQGLWFKARKFAFTPVRSLVRAFGDEGTKLMDLYDFGTKHGEVMSADALNKLEDITNGLDWKELDSLGLLLRQNGSPPSGQLSKERGEGTYLFAHDLLAGLGDDLAKLIGKAGGEAQKARVSSSITTRFKQAFPRLYFTNQLEMGTKYSAENRASVAAFLIGDGRAMDETDALGLIDAALVAGRASNADSIAIGDRTYWTEKGYNKMDLDPTESLQLFFTEAFKEAAMGASFDKNYVKLMDGITSKWSKNDAAWLEKTLGWMRGGDPRGLHEDGTATIVTDTATAMRKMNILTMLNPRSTLTNLTQLFNTFMVVDFESGAKAAAVLFNPSKSGKDMAATTGVLANAVIDSTLDKKLGSGKGLTSTWMKAIGFKWAEMHNNKFAALSGIFYVDSLLTKLEKQPRSWRTKSKLKEIGIDPDKLIAGGLQDDLTINITDSVRKLAKRIGGNEVARQTQFRADIADLPYFWSSPVGRTVTQFQTFAVHQSQLVARTIWNNAKRGNPRPLIVLATMMYGSGKVLEELNEWITGKEVVHDSFIQEFLYDVTLTGGFGLVNDFLLGRKIDADWAKDRAIGPTGNTLTDIKAGMERADWSGDTSQLEALLGSRIPGVNMFKNRYTDPEEGFIDPMAGGGYEKLGSREHQQTIAAHAGSVARRTSITREKVYELYEGGYKQAAFDLAEAHGIEFSESKFEQTRRRKILQDTAKGAVAIDKLSDANNEKFSKIEKFYPVIAKEYANARGFDINYQLEYERSLEKIERGATNVEFMNKPFSLPSRTNLKSMAAYRNLKDGSGAKLTTEKLFKLAARKYFRTKAREFIVRFQEHNDDDDAAMAWGDYLTFWERRNEYLEKNNITPNSSHYDEFRAQDEKYITDLMEFSSGFAEQFTIMPDIFRR